MAAATNLTDLLRDQAARRLNRRVFLRNTGGITAGLVGGLSLSACGQSDDDDDDDMMMPAGPSDADVLNFALNLEYLEAQFYQYAAFGTGLPEDMMGGTGTPGTVTGGGMVSFSDPVVAAYAREIAKDEMDHVRFLRTALGAGAVAQPAIDIGGTDPNGAFSVAARAAGLVGEGEVFDPYASDENFLLGAYIFEDVGVTAYKGAAPLIANKVFLEAAAGILAAEAYHAGLVRTVLYSKGVETPALREATVAISAARDSLDGSESVDQGVIGDEQTSNIVPLDENGIAFSRSPGDVLNIVYLSTEAVSQGGFFPNGVNGAVAMSSALS